MGLSSRVIKAIGIFGSVEVVGILCGVARAKLTAVWIGAAGVGLFAIFNSAINLVTALCNLNIRTSSVKTLAAAGPDARPGVEAVVRRLGLILAAVALLVMLVAAPLFSFNAFGDLSRSWAFALLGLAVAASVMRAPEEAILQGEGLLRPLARGVITAQLLGLVVSLLLLWFFRLDGILPSLLAYSVFGYLGVLIFRKPPVPLRVPLARLREVGLPILRLGAYMSIAAIFCELLNYLLVCWLNRVGDTSLVGLFQSGHTLVNRYLGIIFTAIAMEFYPRLAAAEGHPRRQSVFISHEIILLSLLLLGPVLLFYPCARLILRILYTPEFYPAVPYIYGALPGMTAQVAGWVCSYYILTCGAGRLYIITEVISQTAIILLSILGFTLAGLAGMGLGFTAGQIVTTIVNLICCRRYLSLRLAPRALLVALLIPLLTLLLALAALTLTP